MRRKKVLHKILAGILITTISIPVNASAAEINGKEYTLDKELCLSSDIPYEKVTELGTTPVDKSFSCMSDYFHPDCMSVSVSASMDGKNPVDLYWSDTPYLLQSDETAYVAVMKADDTQTWTTDSSIVIKMEDVLPLAAAIQIDMGASKEGPRDYRMEYSTDEGKTWKSFSQTDKTTLSVNSPQTIGTIFSENIDFIERDYTLKTSYITLPNGVIFVDEFKMQHDVYFKISVDSDYRADGTEGLLGSSQGEVAIQSIRLYEYANVADDSVTGNEYDTKLPELDNGSEVTQPESGNNSEVTQPESGNNSEVTQPESGNKSEVTQPESGNKSEVTQPESGNKSEVTQPESGNGSEVTQPQSTTTQNLETSTENTINTQKKASQIVTLKQTNKTYKASTLKKKSRSFSLKVSVKGDANVSYKKLSGSPKLSINQKTGKITVRKGTKKGTYQMKVKVQVAETNEYQPTNITKKITVKVK